MGLRTTFYLILRPVRELERARTSLFVWFDRPDGRTGDYTTSSIREISFPSSTKSSTFTQSIMLILTSTQKHSSETGAASMEKKIRIFFWIFFFPIFFM